MTVNPLNAFRHPGLEAFAQALALGVSTELYMTPKPGLVDLMDNGSHPDLSITIMEHSIGIVASYLDDIVFSLRSGEPFACQQQIAIRAEQRLSCELGTNTHKGFIFLSGMLLIARYHAKAPTESAVRESLSSLSAMFFRSAGVTTTNGERVRRKYNTGGIVQEAVDGYPSVFEEALPAFRGALKRHGCVTRASFMMMARLMQTVDDTTALHRAGPCGLSRVKQDGRRLEQIVSEGGEFGPFLEELNHEYKKLRLTIGGVADMLGISFGCLRAQSDIFFGSVIAPGFGSVQALTCV